MLEESSLIYLLWLVIALKPANLKINRLLEAFSMPEDVYFAPIDELGRIAGLSAEDIKALEDGRSLTQAQKVLNICREKEISICTIYDDIYPERFRTVPNPPTLFFYKGSPVWDEAPLNIAVVGTRDMTKYGYTVTKELSLQLSDCGCMIISGMAYGVDAAAQNIVLQNGGKTIAFLAGGVDVIYPKDHIVLYYDIIDNGCVISEFLPGERNLRHHFQIRNRLIAAMSDGVLITQAPKISGSLITAKWAAEFNRDVFAVPGAIDDLECEGTNALIADGAKLTRNAQDILSEYGQVFSGAVKKYGKIEENTDNSELSYEKNSSIEKIIFLLKDADYDCSSLSELSEIPLGELILLLTDLQIKGIITEKPGGIYALSKGVVL